MICCRMIALQSIAFAICLCSFVSDGARLAIDLSPTAFSNPQEEIASKYGLTYLGQVGNLKTVYLFSDTLHPSTKSISLNISEIASNPDVKSVFEQVPLLRYLRYSSPTDPMWPQQWALHNVGQLDMEFQELDMNVEPAWQQGLTGEGVIVGIVDDGIMYTHEELRDNFIATYSSDVADWDSDVYPSTVLSNGKLYRHGTSCAGVVAMAKDNDICGVGVAYHSKVAGIRLLSSTHHTDATEASALGLHNQHIHIYSNSWGPQDNGINVDGPGKLAQAALRQGILEGRGGKGSIYMWASGNGGSIDSCSTDGYVSSIYTIAVGSADQRGQRAYYDESCPSKMVVAVHHHKRLTSKSVKTQTITTAAIDGQCRTNFIGTSVACPLVAGAIALTLQANVDLTWRDVQYLLAYTARREGLGSPHQWTTNGGGLAISQNYGFGAVNVEALVSRARHWTVVPPQHSCIIPSLLSQRFVTAGHSQHVLFNVDMSTCALTYLEHVVLSVSLKLGEAYQHYSYVDYITLNFFGDKTRLKNLINHGDVRRGDVSISLVSPHGTESLLLPRRPRDFVNTQGFRNWPFMSVRHWGESAQGEWLVNISYTPHSHSRGYVKVTSLKLKLYGTVHTPEAVLAIPGQCDQQCQGACGGEGPFLCDVCKSVRNAVTLECMDSCLESDILQGNYCIPSSSNLSNATATMDVPPTKRLSTTLLSTDKSSTHVGGAALLSNTPCIHGSYLWTIYLLNVVFMCHQIIL